MEIIINWIIVTLAVLAAAYILPGVSIASFWVALIVALVIGILNTLVKPILIVLTLPINILTLGLFVFIINAVLILLASAVVPGFDVDGFWWALLFSIILALILALTNLVFS